MVKEQRGQKQVQLMLKFFPELHFMQCKNVFEVILLTKVVFVFIYKEYLLHMFSKF